MRAGLARVRAQGKRLGRPVVDVPEERLAPVRGLSVREAARRLGVLGLGVARGHTIRVSAEGEDADAVVATLVEMVQSGLGGPIGSI